MRSEPSLGIVVPAYDPDVDRLSGYVRRLDRRFDPATLRVELDDPAPGVADACSRLPATVAVSPRRRGKGAAVTAGFEALGTDLLLFVDADGSTGVDSVAQVLEPLYDGRADLTTGSRRHPDSTVGSHQTLFRRRLGDAFAWSARRLLETELYDFQCGAKALTAEAWTTLRPHLYEPGFAWDVELLGMAGALGLRVHEVPIRWEDAPGSTVDPLSTAVELARALFAVRHRTKRVGDSRLHAAIGDRRDETALVERGDGSTGRDDRERGR
jgi:glycosyltransferase involved in cell wall biosynthesis